jgi:putative aldouronate transport system substrate-binding protein
VNGKYEWSAGQPGMVDGIKAFRKIVDDGTLWKDQPIAKGNAALDRYYAGEVGLCMQYWNIGRVMGARQKMIAVLGLNVEQARDATALMHIQMKNGSLFALPVEDYWSVLVFSPKMDDVEMDRFLQVANWSASSEGCLSIKYGPKGKGWDYVGTTPKALIAVNPDTKAFIYPDSIVAGWGTFLPISSDDSILNGRLEVGRQELKVYEDTDAFSNLYKGHLKGNKPFDNYTRFFSGPNFNKYGNFASDVNTKVLDIVYSGKVPADQIEKAWTDWVASKMPQVQSVLDELNAGIKK